MATQTAATSTSATGTSSPTVKSPKSEDGSTAVSVLLEPAVHDYYAQQAKLDERTLNKYLARLIKAAWQQATQPGSGSGSNGISSNGDGDGISLNGGSTPAA